MKRRSAAIGLLGIVALALALRLLGLRLGLPFIHHWDEGWIVASARSMLARGDDIPLSYQYGAPLMRLTVWGSELVHLVRPDVSPEDDILLRWVARSVSVIFSCSGVIGAYLAGRFAESEEPIFEGRSTRLCGLGSAFLFATAQELVTHARYGVTDSILTSMAALSMGFAALYAQKRKLYQIGLSIAFAGLGLAFKLPGLMIAILPALAIVIFPVKTGKWRTRGHRLLTLAAFPIIVSCFFVLNPHMLDQWQLAWRDIAVRVAQTRDGGFPKFLQREPGLVHLGAALWMLLTVMIHRVRAIGLLIAAVSLSGLMRGCARRRGVVVIASFFGVCAILSNALPNRAFLVRNYLVVMPVLALGFGLGLAEIVRYLSRIQGTRLRRGLLAVLFVSLFGLSASAAHGAISNHLLSEDPRLRAMDWIDAHRRGSKVTVALTPSVVGTVALAAHPAARQALSRPGATFVPSEARSPEDVLRSKPHYVITASYRDLDKVDPYEEQWFFKDVPGYREVATFTPNPYEHNFEITATWDGRVTARILERSEK